MFKRARNILFTLPLSLFFALLSSSNALSENEVWRVHLTGDINPSTRDSSPQHLTVVEDSLYFAANNNELWITDGSTANTRLVTDFSKISPGAYIGDETAAFNGTFYFSAYTPESGHGLWRSDGTESGTWLVKDVNQGKTLTASEHLLYFVANGGELWATDGSTNGTYLVKDVGQQNFNIINMIDVKGTLFFSIGSITYGTELWKSDGTEDGTVLVKDINVGSASSSPRSFVQFNDLLYFVAFTQETGYELWRSDGTEEGTHIFNELSVNATQPSVGTIVVAGQKLYFTSGSSSNWDTLWVSDGTEGGTRIVADSLFRLLQVLAGDEHLYFVYDDQDVGAEVWVTDGETITLLKDVNFGREGSNPTLLAATADGVFFSAYDGTDHGLWFSSGAEVSTKLMKGFWEMGEFATFKEKLYLAAEGDLKGEELWASDGTANGTQRIVDINQEPFGSSPTNFTPVENNLYFLAETGTGVQLFRIDEDKEHAVMITGYQVDSSPDFRYFTNVQGNFYFFTRVSNIFYLWKVEGTETSATLVRQFAAGCFTLRSAADVTEAVDAILYFIMSNESQGCSLWRSDGTEIGTYPIVDVANDVDQMLAVGNGLYYVGRGTDIGYALWRSDGTANGTQMLKAFGSKNPQLFLDYKGMLFFRASDGILGEELWRTDGTQAGTHIVRDIYEGSISSIPHGLTILGDVIYFSAASSGHGRELWRSDGSEAGTWEVADLRPGYDSSEPRDFKVVGDQLFFIGDQVNDVRTLWGLDGSTGDVEIIIEDSEEPGKVLALEGGGNVLFLVVYDEGHDRTSLWVGEATENQMISAESLQMVEGSIRPFANFTQVGSSLVFSALDMANRYGEEVWRAVKGKIGVELVAEGSAIIAEDGGETTYTLALSAPPIEPVEIMIMGDSQVSVSPSQLFFTPEFWRTPQTVTVTAVNDTIAEGLHSGTITHSITTDDPDYRALGNFTYHVTIVDAGAEITSIYLPLIKR